MSDDDFFMEDEFEYEQDEQEDVDIDLENKYYSAKSKKEHSLPDAISEFLQLLETDAGKSDWGFKALKQLTKTSFLCSKLDDSINYYAQLLNYINNIAQNYIEKSINNLLDFVSTGGDMIFLEKLYTMTLESLSKTQNDRLSIKTNLKLAKLLLDRHEYVRLTKLLKQLVVQVNQEKDDPRKGTTLLEIYALEIQMYTETKDNKKLQVLYKKCLHVKSAIPHPKIQGVIRECGGKMHMNEGSWAEAQQDFFESFKNYDEAGSPQRIQVLKEYIDDVLYHIRIRVLEALIRPYTRVEISFLANQLNVTSEEVEDLWVALILDGKVDGKIDQINKRLVVNHKRNEGLDYAEIVGWFQGLESVMQNYTLKGF